MEGRSQCPTPKKAGWAMLCCMKNVNVEELTIALLFEARLLLSNCKFTLTRPCCFVSLHLGISSRTVHPADDSIYCLPALDVRVTAMGGAMSRLKT